MQVRVSFSRKVLSGCMSRSGIAGSYGSSMYRFLWYLHTVLHSGCISLSYHQGYRMVPFSPHPLQNLFCGLINDDQSDWCEVVSHSSFSFWFWVWCPDGAISIFLSCKSLIHASALFIVLFIDFNSVCISANEFYNFSWLLMFPSCLPKESALVFISSLNSLIFSLNSFSIFIIYLFS